MFLHKKKKKEPKFKFKNNIFLFSLLFILSFSLKPTQSHPLLFIKPT